MHFTGAIFVDWRYEVNFITLIQYYILTGKINDTWANCIISSIKTSLWVYPEHQKIRLFHFFWFLKNLSWKIWFLTNAVTPRHSGNHIVPVTLVHL